ncbi:MAG: N-formylglutamate deformylase [Hyphomicrobiales bacterium]
MTPVDVMSGDGPIVLGLPHTGTYVPPSVDFKLNKNGHELADTDWNVDKLYEGLLPDASMVRANFHRYVIDANRDPSGVSLYPGQNTTGLCPTTDFDGLPIYQSGAEPNADEVERRRLSFHAPYHDALELELKRVREIHGIAVLYDCHSIRSNIPFLYEGKLPDFNIGTNLGTTCDPGFEAETLRICEDQTQFTHIVNGRFKGGWTTRHYGRPAENIHAIQMELAQSTYMEEIAPWKYSAEKAAIIRPVLKEILTVISSLARSLKSQPSQNDIQQTEEIS